MLKIAFFSWLKIIINAIKAPLLLLIVSILAYFFIPIISSFFIHGLFFREKPKVILDIAFSITLFVSIFWFLSNVLNLVRDYIEKFFLSYNKKIIRMILPLIDNSLKIILFISLLYFLTAYLQLPDTYQIALQKTVTIVIILAIAIILMRVINGYEKLLMGFYSTDLNVANFKARQVYTQISIFKRVALTVISILTIASILTVFDRVREIGVSIFASAGILTAIIGFSAQHSLANLMACLQIAITQPIKIGDTVKVEGENGNIEEITMTYVVVKVWDLRRLIIPLSYFIEKPFQNFTRYSTNLLCPVYLYVDYMVPVNALRNEFLRLLNNSSYWDKGTQALHVSNAKPDVLELRFLASAADFNKAWELSCEIREKMVAFINKNYPQALPTQRTKIEYRENMEEKRYEKNQQTY